MPNAGALLHIKQNTTADIQKRAKQLKYQNIFKEFSNPEIAIYTSIPMRLGNMRLPIGSVAPLG